MEYKDIIKGIKKHEEDIVDINGKLDTKINKNDVYVNVKDFGAKGDGVSDDTQAIKNALNNKGSKSLFFPTGEYICKESLYFSSGEYIGEYGTVIVAESFDSEHFIKNKNNILNSTSYDTLHFKNIKFKMGKQGGKSNGVLIGLFNTINSSITHCSFESIENNPNNTWGIDLYTNNKNCIISNCDFNLKANDTVLTTSISIREFSSLQITENITVRDCVIYEEGKDEDIWVSEWNGKLKNIMFNNINIKDKNKSESIIFLGGGQNINFLNSTVEVDTLIGRMLTFGNESLLEEQSNNVENCIFRAKNLGANSTIVKGSDKITDKNKIRNCVFEVINKNSYKIDGLDVICESDSNVFIGDFNTVMKNVYSSKNDNLEKSTGSLRDVYYIENIKYNSPSSYFLIFENLSEGKVLTLKNCKINCKQLIQYINLNTGQTANIENCNITKADWQLIVSTKNDTVDNCLFYISDTNIISPTQFRFVDKPYLTIIPSNVRVNNELYKGIPGNEIDRAAVKVGTIFPSSNNGKIIVRKILEGDNTSCWEEI